VRRFLCVLLVLAFAGSLVAGASADCRAFRQGEKVALLGSADDPDVFVWDSQFRLATYQTGTYDEAKALLPHAWTVPPGTRAVVIRCVPGFVHPKYRGTTDDALDIFMLGGPYRRRSGWVMGQDLRRMRSR
jgi:hypothetical protein